MRHSDFRTIMNIYGTVFDELLQAATKRIAKLAFQKGTQAGLDES
jgi:hypothetical protein